MRSKPDLELAQIVWDYMRYEQPLERADLIIGLGCHDIGVAKYAAELYLDQYAPLIMFCGSRGRLTEKFKQTEADWFADEAIRLGVPTSRIIRETESTNTGENILFGYKKLISLDIKPKKIIIVHKPYMLRRDFATIRKQWPSNHPPEFLFCAEPSTLQMYTNNLLELTKTINVMLGDLQRIREYPKLGYQIEQIIPKDVWSAYEELVKRGYTTQLLK